MASHIYIVMLLCCFGGLLSAQGQVLPGDANANGRVDHYDLLPIGFAFGHTGPSRLVEASNIPQDILALWPYDFPTGINYIHADADGNGRVDLLDFALFNLNQGLEDGPVQELAFIQPASITGSAIRLNNGNQINPQLGVTNLDIPIHVQTAPTAPDLNGLAFEIELDPDYVVSASFSFSDEWMNADNMAVPYLSYEENTIKIAITRLGANPVEGGGLLGRLHVIIVEDLVGIIPPGPDTSLEFVTVNNVLGVDGDFNTTAVTSQGLAFGPLDTTSGTKGQQPDKSLSVSLAPNPVQGEIMLQSDYSFTRVELFDLQGHQQVLYNGSPMKSWRGHLGELPAALYFLRLQGDEGQTVLRFIYSAE